MTVLKPIKNPLKLAKLLARPQKHYSGKVFPSGRFSLGSTPKKSLAPDSARDEINEKATLCDLSSKDFFYGSYGEFSGSALSELPESGYGPVSLLGLSSPAISRTRSPRGVRGISARQADLIKYWISQLEAKYSRSSLSFLTLTVPNVGEHLRNAIQSKWATIVHRFVESLKRILCRYGSPSDAIFGCTEIQIKRSQKEGWNVPHLHLVFVGKRTRKDSWIVTPRRVRIIWRRVLFNAVGPFDADFGASENLQRVRFSAARYLSKYISKGSSKSVTRATDGEWHPSDYIVCGRRFRRDFKCRTVGGFEVGRFIFELLRRNTLLTDWYAKPVCIETSIGPQVFGWVGYCSELVWPAPDEIW